MEILVPANGWPCGGPGAGSWEATLPIYEFKCRGCGSGFEAIRPMGDAGSNLTCPACGDADLEKQSSVFSACGGSGSGARPPRSSCSSGFS